MPTLAGEDEIQLVSVIILTRNRCDQLMESINSVKNQDFPGIEIIVVDNASEDDTALTLKEKYPDVKLIKLEENRGVGGRNIGADEATGELIISLDDDSKLLQENTITRIVEKFRRNSDLGAAGFRVIDGEGEEDKWFRWKKVGSEKEGYLSPTFRTCAAAIRPEMFERTGGFWDRYFIYVEERDFATRILNSGAEVRYFPLITILHRRANRNRETSRLFYYVTRNSTWYFWRNFSVPLAFGKTFLFWGKQFFKSFAKRNGLKLFFQALIHAADGMGEALETRKPVKRKYMSLVEGDFGDLEDGTD